MALVGLNIQLLEITPGLADDIGQGFSYFCDILSAIEHQLRPHCLVDVYPGRTSHFVAAPPLFTLIEVLVVLTTLVKNYLKLWEIQLADYCLVDYLVGLE